MAPRRRGLLASRSRRYAPVQASKTWIVELKPLTKRREPQACAKAPVERSARRSAARRTIIESSCEGIPRCSSPAPIGARQAAPICFRSFPRPGRTARLPLESGNVTDDLPKISWKHARPFRVGDFEVLPASGELLGRRGTQRVRPLLMDILLRLAAQPGEVVRRETLLEDVWSRRMVNDEVLSRAIAELRTALGDDARGARYIETLPKLGYRLVAPVHDLATVLDPPTPPV